jgi:hypothetical protein
MIGILSISVLVTAVAKPKEAWASLWLDVRLLHTRLNILGDHIMAMTF